MGDDAEREAAYESRIALLKARHRVISADAIPHLGDRAECKHLERDLDLSRRIRRLKRKHGVQSADGIGTPADRDECRALENALLSHRQGPAAPPPPVIPIGGFGGGAADAGAYSDTPEPPLSGKAGRWHTDMSDCFIDCPLCWKTCWCPCVVFGKNREAITGEDWRLPCVMYACCFDFICLCHREHRKDLRDRFELPRTCRNDLCATCLCWSCCAICQEAREIKYRVELSMQKGPVPQEMLQLLE